MGFRKFGIFWHPNFQILASCLQKNLATLAGARLRHSFPFLSASEFVRLAAGSSHSFQKHLLPMVFGSFCGRASAEITAGVR